MRLDVFITGDIDIEVDDEVAERLRGGDLRQNAEDLAYNIGVLRLELSSIDGFADLKDSQAKILYENIDVDDITVVEC